MLLFREEEKQRKQQEKRKGKADIGTGALDTGPIKKKKASRGPGKAKDAPLSVVLGDCGSDPVHAS